MSRRMSSRSKNEDSTSDYVGEKQDPHAKNGSTSSNGRDKQYHSTADDMVYNGDSKHQNGSRSSANNSNKTQR